jgi:hypothetical protein
MMFGTATNTYVFPGATSAASTASQSGPLYVVTTDATGHVAAMDISLFGAGPGSLPGRVDGLEYRDRVLSEGIAMAFAMDAPDLQAGETFAVSGNWGTFEGDHAIAAGFAARLAPNVTFNGGIAAGSGEGTLGGKAGLRFGW